MAFPREILTGRLRLRPPTLADAEQIFARYGHDPKVVRYLSWKPHQSINGTLEFLHRIVGENEAGRNCGYLIFAKESGDLLGSVGGAIEKHRMTFGYCLAQDSWGKGYATEAARAFVGAAFSHPDVLRIQAYCDLENGASTRVLEKTGLSLEGILRRYMVLPNLCDTPRDVFSYAIVREED